jgi:hypothetical protein
MPIFNAWCDRTPMIIFGATGPVDAHRRRPWIDWIHTSKDQAPKIIIGVRSHQALKIGMLACISPTFE